MRKIRILPFCQKRIDRQIIWYAENAGTSFIKTMLKNLQNDIHTLSSMPSIGKKKYEADGHQYYTFPSKKKAEIIYWFDDETLYIADVVFYFSKR